MVYRHDKRPIRHRGRYTILGIVFGVIITIGGFYFYDNYKQPIINNVSQASNSIITQVEKNNPISNTIHSIQDTSQNNQLSSNNEQSSTSIDSSTLEHQIHQLINNAREQSGLKPLIYDEKLASIAREHSKDMALNNYFDHTSPTGIDLQTRYKNANYFCYGWSGENIQQQTSNSDLLNTSFQTWMNSEGHKENILESNFSHEGIGVYQNGYTVFITEDFC